MKIINLCKAEFDEIYFRLMDYCNPAWLNISYDDCAKKALEYIEDKEILNHNYEENKYEGFGYRLIYSYYGFDPNCCRYFYITPNKDRIIYEGIISMRFFDELKYPDYTSLKPDELKIICKKYNLIEK